MPNADLYNSRWAPASSRGSLHNDSSHLPSPTPQSIPTSLPLSRTQPSKSVQLQRLYSQRHQEYLRFNKLLRRLRWKATTLLFCYQRALRQIHNHNYSHDQIRQPDQPDPQLPEYPMSATEAETMFKIDFFEFYVLLERLLIHLLRIFGIEVSATHAINIRDIEADGSRQDTTTTNDNDSFMPPPHVNTLVGDSQAFPGHPHRFHANVLSALDHPTSPLYDTLGRPPVRDYLGIAKEFRNRWKDAEEKEKNEVDDGLVGSRYERMMRDLRIEEMLGCILNGVGGCVELAEGELERKKGEILGLGLGVMEVDSGSMENEVLLEAVEDAMEWD